MVRAKFQVTKVSEFGHGGARQEIQRSVKTGEHTVQYESTGVPVREVTMHAVYCGSEENRSFAEATSAGEITIIVNNAACADEFKPGQAYYVDFTPTQE